VAELPTWKNIDIACMVFRPGNSMEFLTGDWRSMRPERDDEKCVKCGKCWMYCPEAAISGDDYAIDYDYCKGCGICAKECPYGVIVMVEECE
jgi:pyruvate ferredoxin oxidoreductase delta subunit